MRESRLFQILYQLLDQERTTAPALATALEVSVRTIYRDIDALSEAGIPVYAEPGRNGGIYLMSNFVLDKAILSNDEKQDILAAIQNLSIANPDYAQDTLQKLSALFQTSAHDWYEIDFSRWGDKPQDHQKFESLKHAIITCTAVRILYANSSGACEERLVYPLKLLYKAKNWYLKAFCTAKQDFRLFKLSRIIRYTLLEETFPPTAYPQETQRSAQNAPDGTGEEHSIQVRLRFSKEAAYRAYDEFDEHQIIRLENGDLIACAKVPPGEWLIGYLLSFGTQIEVLEPAFLRDMLARQAKDIWEKYTN